MMRLSALACLFLVGASMATAQVTVPPPAPPIKSGTFVCSMHGSDESQFRLEGIVGDWKQFPNQRQAARVRVSAPEQTGLSGNYLLVIEPGRLAFTSFDPETTIKIEADMKAGWAPYGMIMIERTRITGGRSTSLYVGTCEVKMSPEPRELPA